MSTNSEPTLPLSPASKIASYSIYPSTTSSPNAIELSQVGHRINLLNTPAWSPFFKPKGIRILEIGCGQGTCTQVLAHLANLSGGHVDAIDPAPLDYGAPWTLGQAQAHLSGGPLKDCITWHQADPVEFLSRTAQNSKWDVAVLAHCIWYFKSPMELSQILTALKGRVKAVCIAEYALHATKKGAVPHVLASLARAAFEAHRRDSEENIQTTLSPVGITKIAEGAGWAVKGEDVVVPDGGLSDGGWEAGTVVGAEFVTDVEREVEDERVRALLVAARDATVAAVEGVGGMGNVRTMDVWVASLVER